MGIKIEIINNKGKKVFDYFLLENAIIKNIYGDIEKTNDSLFYISVIDYRHKIIDVVSTYGITLKRANKLLNYWLDDAKVVFKNCTINIIDYHK